ncbi:MAG TPA: hypothetical protein VEY71_13125, partial [Chitinophagales bacterium]|nr:hypothetical protein [Chitinophagales bacterium]
MTSSKNIIASLMLTASVLFAFNASAQLTGAYTIDATQPTGGTNFQSFTEFSAALTADGVSGPVAA